MQEATVTSSERDLDKAIELAPTLSGAYYIRGIALQGFGQPELAKQDRTRACELNRKLC